MKDFAENVVVFNEEVLKFKRPERGLLPSPLMDHALKCIDEEFNEMVEAYSAGNYVGTVDAVIDLMYFAVGILHKMGLTPEQMAVCGRIVHTANMKKSLGIVEKRATGAPDATKPEDWVAPEDLIRTYLEGC